MRTLCLFLVLTACGEKQTEPESEEQNDNNQSTESYMPYCEEVETFLTQDELSPLGISIDDFMDNVALNYTKTIIWEDGVEMCLSGSIGPDMSTIRFVESTEVYPEAPAGVDVPAIAVYCPDYLAVDGYINLLTPDGMLDEEYFVSFVISEETLWDDEAPINATYSFEVEEFTGHFTPEGAFDSITVSGEVGTVFTGRLNMMTSGTDGEIAWAGNETLAEWGEDAASDCPEFE